MNVLLTSVGRRAYMVRYFREALGGEGKVHVCNSDNQSVAFHYADKYVISPLIYDPSYIPFLLKYCKENHIDFILSLFDMDLLMLSMHKDKFEDIGTKVIVSNQPFIEICNDKWKTFQFLEKNGIPAPKTYLTIQQILMALGSGEVDFPIIIKPRFGCGSISLAIAEDEMIMMQLYRKISKEVDHNYLKYESAAVEEKVIFQEYLQGKEYGVDIINDLDGNFKNAIIKEKMAMRSGETDIAETVTFPEIYLLAEKIGKISEHIGNVDMDIFVNNEKPYVLDMNARFGGGYPFSHVAGCDLPLAIVKWCKGEVVENEMLQARPGILSYKEIVLTSKAIDESADNGEIMF